MVWVSKLCEHPEQYLEESSKGKRKKQNFGFWRILGLAISLDLTCYGFSPGEFVVAATT